MNEQLKKKINEIQQQFKLENYSLGTWSIFHEKRSLSNSNYVLSMEWYPNEVDNNLTDDDLNPNGTIIIDIDFHSGDLYQIVFVNNVSNKDAKDTFPTPQRSSVIQWIEKVTGLTVDKHFMLTNEENNKYYFQAAIDHLPTIPLGTIQVDFNGQDELILFSIDGVFPNKSKIVPETFTLKLEDMHHLFKQQLKLFELPVVNKGRWTPVYTIDELYVKNYNMTTIQDPAEQDERLDLTFEWSEPLAGSVEQLEEIDLSTEVTYEQALENKPHPDNKPVTAVDKEKAIEKLRDFLRREYPLDSGKWFLYKVYREHGYLTSELKLANETQRVIRRKLTVMMNPTDFKIINYIDNEAFLEMFDDYLEAETITITPDTAFEKLKDKLSLTPVYVYESDNNQYALYGQIGSEYGVLATTGEIVNLNDL